MSLTPKQIKDKLSEFTTSIEGEKRDKHSVPIWTKGNVISIFEYVYSIYEIKFEHFDEWTNKLRENNIKIIIWRSEPEVRDGFYYLRVSFISANKINNGNIIIDEYNSLKYEGKATV